MTDDRCTFAARRSEVTTMLEVRLDPDDCWARLERTRHATFGTVHPTRGVDAVPVVFAITPDRRIVLPIDTVKPKTTTDLQRRANVRADERCVLLVDRYDDDWQQLWWVRVHGRATDAPTTPAIVELLAARYPAYRDPAALTGAAIVVTPDRITGWAASG
jgi:PPOX class probable F420-dependent enzyme